MKKGNRYFAAICLGLSLWLVLESFQLDYKTGFTPGPGFEPFWLGVALALLSVSLLIETYFKKSTEKDSRSHLPDHKALMRVGTIVLILVGFTALMSIIGFLGTVFLFVAMILFLLEGDGLLPSIACGAFYSSFVFVVFKYWMQLDLPKGWIGL